MRGEIVIPDGVDVGRGPVVENWNEGEEEDGGKGRDVRLQLQSVAIQGALEGAGPNLVKRGYDDACDGIACADDVETKVGDGGDDYAKAYGEQGHLEGVVEILLVEDGLKNDDGGRGHDLHDLVEADAVVLQAEVCEGDEAHGAHGELGDVSDGEFFNFKEA